MKIQKKNGLCDPQAFFSDAVSLVSRLISDNLWKWLEEGRNWARQATELDQYYSKLCPEKVSHGENFLCTEFSLKFLFGSKGYALEAGKRYDKLAAMADILKERCKLRMWTFPGVFHSFFFSEKSWMGKEFSFGSLKGYFLFSLFQFGPVALPTYYLLPLSSIFCPHQEV